MKIVASTDNRITVLELDGNLTIGTADETFSAAIERQIDAGRADIVLDMERVGVVDSTGLGSLVRSHHRCVQSGGGLRLANLDFHVWELFQAARIAGVIPIFENLQAALKGPEEC
jgi:anti-sigma B factor antagonist